MPPVSPWWTPAVHADRAPFLMARTRIHRAMRDWFAGQDFIEVEPACLQVSPGNEAHLHAFKTELIAPDLGRETLFLHTSPEIACKKLLASGWTRLFAFAPVFRNRERGPLHAPEFTMLEWYSADENFDRLMEQCVALTALAARHGGTGQLSWRGASCDPQGEAERLTVADALRRHAGIDLLGTVGTDGNDRDALAAAASAAGIAPRPDDTWSDIFSKVLTALIEPKLGFGVPTLLIDYPASEAPLARPKPGDPRVAERFELYCCGVEVANGFGELTDPVLQRQRLEAEMDTKEERYGERYPIDEDFIAALAHMPPSCGCALGFDRLVMLATGARRIDQVIWTPLAQGSK
ncbi:MAG: EF-P lysine aminoacylase EpmA [Hyphomicrobium sp.]|uniref:EF-P lysine aminoacylase EpmA n=1 Tax=Hyphomicrobium sp. TaxID=82 RepID=UPI003D0D2078